MSQWYVSIDGQQMGPYDEGVFRSYVEAGRIQKEYPVWKEGMSAWLPASEVTELKPFFSSPAPATPPVPPKPSFSQGSLSGGAPISTPVTARVRGTGASLPPSTHKGAVASLILGVIGFVFAGPFVSIPAIIVGHKARRDLRQNPHLQGKGMATVGMALGYLQTAFLLLLVGFMLIVTLSNRQNEDSQQTCDMHLVHLQEVKEHWAIAENKPMTAIPSWSDLEPYLDMESGYPSCPDGGAYILGDVSTPPICSYHGD